MEETTIRMEPPSFGRSPEEGAATVGALAGFGALFSAAACCVLPLLLGAVGVGVGGLAAFVPFHWPLTVAAMVALGVGWLIYFRKRRACSRDAACAASPSARATLTMLCIATGFVLISASWSYIEAPLMRALGGA